MVELLLPRESLAYEGLADVKGLGPRWTERFKKLDVNQDGVLDVAEVMQVVEDMMYQKQMKKLFMWITFGLLVAVAILIGTITGSTFAIVQLAKDTKVSGDTPAYAFVTTKDNKPTISSGAMLNITAVRFEPYEMRSLIDSAASSGGRQRLLIQDASNYDYYGHVPIETVEQGCELVNHGLISFVLSKSNSDGNIVKGAIAMSTLTVKEQAGCDLPGANEVTAVINIANWKGSMDFIVHCTVAEGCGVWYDSATFVSKDGSTNVTSLFVARRQRRHLIEPVNRVSNTVACPSNMTNCNGGCFVLNTTNSYYCGSCDNYRGMNCEMCTTSRSVFEAVWGIPPEEYKAQVVQPPFCIRCGEGYLLYGWYDCQSRAAVQCFPAAATVTVMGRGAVRMSDLQYGDLVRSRDRSTGTEVYRPVYAFGHRDAHVTVSFMHITAAARTLALSLEHYLPICVDRCTPEDLAAGTAVLTYRPAGATHAWSNVYDVRRQYVWMMGPIAATASFLE